MAMLLIGLALFGTGVSSAATFGSGSLVIPMDTTYQNFGMWRAYGLVYRLLQNGVPVSWAIKQNKATWTTVDFSATALDLRTGAAINGGSAFGYQGGPFVIDSANAAAALPIIQAWWGQYANAPNVHTATASFSADVDIVLRSAPRIALESTNSAIAYGYLNAAGIPDNAGGAWSSSSTNILSQTTIADGGLFEPGTCGSRKYDIFLTPHNGGYSYSLSDPTNLGTRTYAALDYFVFQGGGWNALCHSILSNENAINDLYRNSSASVRSLFLSPVNGGFLTVDGFPSIDNVGGTWTIDPANADLPVAQSVPTTATQALPGGSVQTWRSPVTGGGVQYFANTERVAYFAAAGGIQYDHVLNGTYHNGSGRGKLTYIGGHSYSTSLPYSTNFEAPYLRAFYNALYFNGAAVANLSLLTSPVSVPQGTTSAVQLRLTNTGASVATNVLNVTVTLPVGVTYVPTASPAPTSVSGGGLSPTVLTWASLPNIAGGAIGATINATVNYASLGNQSIGTLSAQYGDVFGESFTANSCHSILVTPRPVPTVDKTPDPQSAFPGAVVSWTLSYANTGDAQLLNGVVEDILPVGFVFKTATPTPTSVVPLVDGTTRLRWSVGTLAANSATQTITLQAYATSATGAFTNSLTLRGEDAAGASYSGSDTAVVNVAPASYTLGKAVDKASALAGEVLTYSLSPSFNTPDLLSDVLVADAIPPNTTYLAASVSTGGLFGFTPIAAEPGLDDNDLVVTQLSASPTTVAEGGAVTVTMTLTNRSGGTLATVTPDPIDVTSGTATCSGPTPPSASSVANNANAVFTFTCTMTSIGEKAFVGGGTGTGGYSFSDGTSNTVLVTRTLNGTGQVVTWRLGSNTGASPGADVVAGAGPGIYGQRGDNTNAFWRYEILTNTWATRANRTDGNAKNGGALIYDGGGYVNGYIYSLRGNNSTNFSRYDIDLNTWATLTNTPDTVNDGGALVYLNGFVYALRGASTNTFWRYTPGTGSWNAMAPIVVGGASYVVTKGGALATDGTYIYAFTGDNGVNPSKRIFLRYDPGTDTWSRLADTVADVGEGGALRRIGGYIYALRGKNTTAFWRYEIATNTWTSLANVPTAVKWGGSLTTDGTSLWAFRGGDKTNFYRYTPATNTWTALANALGTVREGGALAWAPGFGGASRTNTALASKSLVTTGQTVTVTMTLTSASAVSGVVGSITPLVTNGASASCSPVLAPTSVPANTPTVFSWTCTLTAGTINPVPPGSSVSFRTSATGTTPTTTWSAATSNSVLVSPVLSFKTTVANPLAASVFEIRNVAMLSDTGLLPNGLDSNPAHTTILRPALSLTKSVSPTGEVTPGTALVYTLKLVNDGTGTAQGVVVTDAVPTNTGYVTCTTPQGTCGHSAGTVTWTLGNVPAFTTLTLTMTVSAATGLPAGLYTINNTASASATGVTAFNSNTVSNTLRTAPVLSIVKSQSVNPAPDGNGEIQPGATISYSLLVSNTGTASATGVVVTDDIPALATYVAASCSATIGSCSFGSPPARVTFNVGTIAAGGSATLSFQVTADSPSIDAGVISNSARLTATGLVPKNSNFVSYQLTAAPVISVVKSSVPPSGSSVQAGDIITYTLEITNSGNANSLSAYIRDSIPSHTLYVANSTEIWKDLGPPAWVPVPDLAPGQPPVSANMPVFSPCCGDADNDAGTLVVGASNKAIVRFQVQVQPVYGSSVTISNTATAGTSQTAETSSNTVTQSLAPTAATIGRVDLRTLAVSDLLREMVGGREALLRLLAGWDPALALELQDADLATLLEALRAWLDPDGDGQVAVLQWDTLQEIGTLGFFVERNDAGGDWDRLGSTLLPAQLESALGGQYWMADPTVVSGRRYRYRLIEQEAWGAQRTYGPWTLEVVAGTDARDADRPATLARPLGGASGRRAARIDDAAAWSSWRGLAPGFAARKRLAPPPDAAVITESEPQLRARALAAAAKAPPATKAAAQWLRTRGAGLQKVPVTAFAPLFGGGAWSPKSFALTYEGQSVPWRYEAGTDALYFVAERHDTLHTAENAYRALIDGRLDRQMALRSGAGPAAGAGGELIRSSIVLQQDNYAKPDVLRGDVEADYWFWNFLFGGTAFSQLQVPLTLPALAPTAQGATLRIHLQGMTDVLAGDDHRVEVWFNGAFLGDVEWDGPAPATVMVQLSGAQLEVLQASAVPLVLKTVNANTVQWLDRVEVEYTRTLSAATGSIWARDLAPGVYTVTGLPSSTVRVVEAPGTASPVWRTDVTVFAGAAGTWNVTFVAPTAADYLVAADGAIAMPAADVDTLSNLSATNNLADYLIVAPRSLEQTAQALAALRSARYGVAIVWLEDVYDEFAYGRTDPHALDDFLAHVARRWRTPPSHVVLVGLGTLDHKNRLGYGESRIPVLMADTPWGLVPSDQRFAFVDGEPFFALGRIPVATEAEGLAYVDKLRAYEETAPGPGATSALLVADNPDLAGDFHTNTDQTRALLEGNGFGVRSLYHCTSAADLADPSKPCSAVRSELTKSSSWEVALVSYDGHGALQQLGDSSELFLVADGVYYPNDVATLANARLPIFSAFTCSVGSDAFPGVRSLAGKLVQKGGGGAVAALAPTGLSLDEDAHPIALRALDELAGRRLTLGEALAEALFAVEGQVTPFMRDIYQVTGDPAVLLP